MTVLITCIQRDGTGVTVLKEGRLLFQNDRIWDIWVHGLEHVPSYAVPI